MRRTLNTKHKTLNLNCIIVEDEPVSQDILKRYISDIPQLKLVGVCNNAFEAQELLLDEAVHLMFLDINMPKLSGMSFLRSLSNPPLVIFTTAYPQYAIEGFEVDAVDYLLKPFSFDRFIKAVNKAVERLKSKENPSKHEDFVMLKADKKLYKVPVKQISHLEALGDYVKVYFGDSVILVHDTLQHLLEEINSPDLIRVHRSWAVSLQNISYIDGNSAMMGALEIPIGKSYKEEFLSKFNRK